MFINMCATFNTIDIPAMLFDSTAIQLLVFYGCIPTSKPTYLTTIRYRTGLVWRMIWAKSTYLNDSRRNPAAAGF